MKVFLGDELVNRQQLDRGDPEALEVGDDRRRGETGIRPAQLGGTSGCCMVMPFTWAS